MTINKIEKHKEILNNMHELYIKKNSDYGDSVHQTYLKYGPVSFLVRIEDKLNRINSLLKNEQKVEDEKIEDTLVDMANYCILMLLEILEEHSSKLD